MKNKLNLLFRIQRNKLSLLMMFIIGLMCFFVSQTDVAAQGIPSGSYQKSCTVIGVDGYVLKAECNTAGIIDSVVKPKNKTWLNFQFCIGDISNNDGKLFCPKDLQAEEKSAANAPKLTPQEKELIFSSLSAFTSAAVVVLGRQPYSDEEINHWNKLMMNNYGMSQQVKEGLKFSDGVVFLKQYIARPEGSSARAHLINRAFDEVYGRPSSPTEQAYWDTQVKTQQIWYVPMVVKIREELNKKPSDRRTVIQTVYFMVFGRYASEGEVNYWTPRKEDYKAMLEANRNWLYSSNGVNDLVETVTRVLHAKNQKKPIDSEVKTAMAKFTASRKIYIEMYKSK